MSWQFKSKVEIRKEFVEMALQGELSFSEVCRRYKVSRPTGYKWMDRYKEKGEPGLVDEPSRPKSSPNKTGPIVEKAITALRDRHPAWGARKLRAALEGKTKTTPLPSVSTCHAILLREGKIDPQVAGQHRPFKRFERDAPNELWQMDHKGDVPCGPNRCFPLTVLDDHSRFNILLRAHGNQQANTVKEALIDAFRCYGLPLSMIMDNGNPWGDSHGSLWTAFDVWLLCLGITPLHARPYHPQTLGKGERFHRTFKAELLQHLQVDSLDQFQRHFDDWRPIYNHERPHEALGLKPPASAYSLSPRPYPESLPPIEYAPDVKVYTVKSSGCFQFQDHQIYLSRAFAGHLIGLRHAQQEDTLEILFSRIKIAFLNLNTLKISRKEDANLTTHL